MGILKLAVVVIAATCSLSATANEYEDEWWLTTGFKSYHFNRSANYNENNSGIGVEWHFKENHSMMLGTYHNSVRKYSNYLQYSWTPLQIGQVKLGGAVGLVDGYPALNGGKLSPSLMPVATWNFKMFSQDAGLNFVFIPTIGDVDGALAVQLKIRLN